MLTAAQVDDSLIARLSQAVAALHPQPRLGRWRSLTSAIVDAVWSIRSDYDSVTVPVTRRVFDASLNVDASPAGADPLTNAEDRASPDPVPLGQFLARFPDAAALELVSNRQRTSTRGGISKADAVLGHAKVFAAHGLTTR